MADLGGGLKEFEGNKRVLTYCWIHDWMRILRFFSRQIALGGFQKPQSPKPSLRIFTSISASSNSPIIASQVVASLTYIKDNLAIQSMFHYCDLDTIMSQSFQHEMAKKGTEHD